MTLKTLALAVMASAAATTPVAEPANPPSSTVDNGFQAYLNGDYAAALEGLKPLAKEGYAKAQFTLGEMYGNGIGVPQNEAEAARWYRKAAEQGHGLAAERLGEMYADGRGVPRDPERAYVWLDLAASRASGDHQSLIEDERYRVFLQMTPKQRMKAMGLANERRAHEREKAMTPGQFARHEK